MFSCVMLDMVLISEDRPSCSFSFNLVLLMILIATSSEPSFVGAVKARRPHTLQSISYPLFRKKNRGKGASSYLLVD